MSKARPVIAATIGDPAGIGPEVCVKAAQLVQRENLADVVLIGDLEIIRQAARTCGCEVGFDLAREPADASGTNRVRVIDTGKPRTLDYRIGKASASAGRAALEWLELGHDLGRRGLIDGLVLGPLNSDALKLSGIVSHIDDLQPPGTYMLRVSGALRVMPLTEHVPIRDVASTVTVQAVTDAAGMLDRALRKWGFERPRLAIAGLNPHAMFEEDREQIAPAVARLVESGANAVGPVSPDAVFRQAMAGHFDAVVTMYHDQGQIALKTAAFAGACTIYVGLGHVEIAIPHGTAYDIAGTGKADCSSMAAGMRMAARLASGGGFAQ